MAVLMRVYDLESGVLLLDLPLPGSLSFSYGLNMSAQFSGEVPENWPKREEIVVGSPVEIYLENSRLLSGNIQRLEPSLSETIRFSGVGAMDSLYSQPKFPLAYYEDKPLLGVLVELLSRHSWLIGDISSLDDPDQVTSLDLRDEKNLLTQVNKLTGGIVEVFYREGEEILGYPSIDFGRFLRDSHIQALMPDQRPVLPGNNDKIHWIEDLSYQEDLAEAVYAVNALGGSVQDSTGESRVINLGDALADNVNLLLDPEFPIIEDLAERSWATLNLRDYGSTGGRVLATADGTTSGFIGDNTGGAVEQDAWIMYTFVPYPGMLESFSIWCTAVTANAVGFDITWVLQEIDLNDYRTVLVDNLLTGTFTTTDLANTIKKITPDSDYELEPGKLYGIALGFNFNPGPDIFTASFARRAIASTSHSFRFQTRAGKPGVGQLWSATNLLGYIEVITRAIDAPRADFVSEKAEKYTPKKTGANATAAEIEAAGAALYLWSKAYLIDHKPEIKTYNLTATGNRFFPKAGDTIYVNGKARGEYFDPLTRRFVTTYREIAGDLRVDRVQADIEGEAVKLSYNLMNGTGVPRTDMIVSIYDQTENNEPAAGDAAARPWALLLDTLSTTVGPISPNSQMSDGTLAYRVTLSVFSGSYASRPNGVEELYMAGLPYGTISPGGELRIEMVQLPSIENPNVIFDIALQTRNWEYGDVATITVKQVWR